MTRFPIPRGAFEDIVAGCRMDLTTRRYASFVELRVYCERVASAVGLASIEIFGYEDPRSREYAVELGLALQLTNILRDIAKRRRARPALPPLEDLERFGVGEQELLAATRDPRVARPAGLMRCSSSRRSAHAGTTLPRGGCCPRATAARCSRPRSWARSTAPCSRRGRAAATRSGSASQPGQAAQLWIALRTVPRVYWGV